MVGVPQFRADYRCQSWHTCSVRDTGVADLIGSERTGCFALQSRTGCKPVLLIRDSPGIQVAQVSLCNGHVALYEQ
jgi:hypothetical protein